MRLSAHITLNFDAADYIDAAQHQRLLEEHLLSINRNYPDAQLAIRERRERISQNARIVAPKKKVAQSSAD